MKNCLLLAIIGLGLGLPSTAQFVPITAKYRVMIFSTDAAGNQIVLRNQTGVYLRAADGSRLVELDKTVNGGVVPDSATLTIAATGKVYRLAYDAKTAVGVQELSPPLRARSRTRGVIAQVLGPGVYNGVPCEKHKLGGNVVGGYACYSAAYDLPVRIVGLMPSSSGTRQTVLFEVYDVQAGQSPPAGAFQVPPGFAIRVNHSRLPELQ